MATRGNRNKVVVDVLPDIKPEYTGHFGKFVTSGAANYRYKGGKTGATDKIRNLKWEDVSKMKGPELYDVLRQAQRAANANYDRVKKTVGASPATIALDNSGGKITLRGLRTKQPDGTYTYDTNTMRAELARAKQYLNYTTGSVKGAKAYYADVEELAPGFQTMNKDQKKEFWELVRAMESNYSALYHVYGSGDTIKDAMEVIVANQNKPATAEELLEQLRGRAERGYERKIEQPQKSPWTPLR